MLIVKTRSAIIIAMFLLAALSCNRAVITTADVQVIPVNSISLDPNDNVWEAAPLHASKLLLQDMVDPRLMEPSTQEVFVKAIADNSQIAFRLEWSDASQDDLPGPREFVDAAAVQLPAKIEASVPAPQMGEAGKNVEISYWRADWQAIVDGRADEIAALHPNATVDHYPFQAKPMENDADAKARAELRYAPARKLGNNRSGPRDNPVEDLIAAGPGTLSPSPTAWSKGKGIRTKNGWAVVLTRPIPEGFSQASPTQVAFAVWEGTHQESGARKMRTGWVQMIRK